MSFKIPLSIDPLDKGYRYYVSGNSLFVSQTARSEFGYIENTYEKRKKRGGISGFSHSSAVNMRRYLRECVSEYRYMLTLTYPSDYTTNGVESKEHLRRFCQELKRADSRSSLGRYERFSCFWFLEFQERGAPHYHIFSTNYYDYRFVAKLWYRIVNSGDEKHLRAGTRVERLRRGRKGTIGYAGKYAAKQQQKVVPKEFKCVGRFWGVYGNRERIAATTTFYADDLLNDDEIKFYFKELNDYIDNKIDTKEIIKVIHRKGFRLFEIKSRYVKERLMEIINIAEHILFKDIKEPEYEELIPKQYKYHNEFNLLINEPCLLMSKSEYEAYLQLNIKNDWFLSSSDSFDEKLRLIGIITSNLSGYCFRDFEHLGNSQLQGIIDSGYVDYKVKEIDDNGWLCMLEDHKNWVSSLSEKDKRLLGYV